VAVIVGARSPAELAAALVVRIATERFVSRIIGGKRIYCTAGPVLPLVLALAPAPLPEPVLTAAGEDQARVA
jgi:hypothetical protein